MKYVIGLALLFSLACISLKGYCQEQPPVDPYLGVSFNFLGVYRPGWGMGLDLGVKAKTFYAGVEYGGYGTDGLIPKTNTEYFVRGYVPPPAYFETFVGLHGGIVLVDDTFLGIIFLYCYESDAYRETHRFDIGPDFRFQTSKHLMLTAAYTVRRGLSTGINFLLGK